MLRSGPHLVAALLIIAGCAARDAAPGGPPGSPPAAGLHPLEAYEGGSKAVEDRYITALARFFGRPATPGETLLRGTHATGTCAAAEFEVYDIAADAEVPDELAQGVFATPGTYDARVRFSNGLGTPADPGKGFDDKDYDARALAIQMMYPGGQRQDFVLQKSMLPNAQVTQE